MNIQERRNKKGNIISFRVRVFDHRDITTGKQIFKNLTVKYDDSKSEAWNRKNAEKQAVIFEKSVEEQTAATSSISFNDYAEYCRIIKQQAKRITNSTALGYRYKQKRLAPFIGHVQLKNLTPNVLNKAYSAMLKAGVPIKTVHELHIFTHGVLTMALKESIIPRNYAAAATPPKVERQPVEVIMEDELQVFFTALYANKKHYAYQVFFSLLLATGCRIGELCALSWDSVDFKEGRIRICQHFAVDEDNKEHISDGAKTKAGQRWIYLDDTIMDMLTEYRAYYHDRAAMYGSKWNHSFNAVFSSPHRCGNYISPHTAREWLRKFLENNNLPHIRPHQFRHTSISLILDAGISIPDTARRAGHSRPDVTYRLYAKTVRQNDRHCSEAVTKILPGLPQKKS